MEICDAKLRGYTCLYFRFLPFFPDDFEGVTGVAGVVGVAGVTGDMGVTASAFEDGIAPLGGFEVTGIGVFGNAAKDDDIA